MVAFYGSKGTQQSTLQDGTQILTDGFSIFIFVAVNEEWMKLWTVWYNNELYALSKKPKRLHHIKLKSLQVA